MTAGIWRGLLQRTGWVFWALAGPALVAWLAGVGADAVVGYRFPGIDAASGLLLATGFGCCAAGIFRAD